MHPFLFTLYCYVLEGNEIHISDFFVGMKYSISLLDLYLNTNLRVHQLNGIPVFIIALCGYPIAKMEIKETKILKSKNSFYAHF